MPHGTSGPSIGIALAPRGPILVRGHYLRQYSALTSLIRSRCDLGGYNEHKTCVMDFWREYDYNYCNLYNFGIGGHLFG